MVSDLARLNAEGNMEGLLCKRFTFEPCVPRSANIKTENDRFARRAAIDSHLKHGSPVAPTATRARRIEQTGCPCKRFPLRWSSHPFLQSACTTERKQRFGRLCFNTRSKPLERVCKRNKVTGAERRRLKFERCGLLENETVPAAPASLETRLGKLTEKVYLSYEPLCITPCSRLGKLEAYLRKRPARPINREQSW
jgi:hypothetical protein